MTDTKPKQISKKQFNHLCGVAAVRGDFYTRYTSKKATKQGLSPSILTCDGPSNKAVKYVTYSVLYKPSRSLDKRISIPLILAGILGLAWYVYPLRQQAIYFNECVEGGRARVYKVQKTEWMWYGRPVSNCFTD